VLGLLKSVATWEGFALVPSTVLVMADAVTLPASPEPVDVSAYESVRAQVEVEQLKQLSFEGYCALVTSRFPGVHWRRSLAPSATPGTH
jgi:hypothetical protein